MSQLPLAFILITFFPPIQLMNLNLTEHEILQFKTKLLLLQSKEIKCASKPHARTDNLVQSISIFIAFLPRHKFYEYYLALEMREGEIPKTPNMIMLKASSAKNACFRHSTKLLLKESLLS